MRKKDDRKSTGKVSGTLLIPARHQQEQPHVSLCSKAAVFVTWTSDESKPDQRTKAWKDAPCHVMNVPYFFGHRIG